MKRRVIVHQVFRMELSNPLGLAFVDDEINWKDVERRTTAAIFETGANIAEIYNILGLDATSDDFHEKAQSLPKFKSTAKVADHIGVSLSWLLTGDGPSHRTARGRGASSQEIRGTSCSTVVQGNNAGTLIISGGSTMSDHKKELNRIFDNLRVKEQTKLLHYAYQLEDGA